MVSMNASARDRIAERWLDHCVLPVADLGQARQRYARLGFTVAPEGHHPFGTRNACIYFADETYLEPIAIADADKTKKASLHGNTFTIRDAAFRATHGEEGFSALVFRTRDASGDHRRFIEHGVSAGNTFSFSRDFVDPDGRSIEMSFRLAFAAEPGEPAISFFTCERIGQVETDRTSLQNHANGALGIAAIMATAGDPKAAENFVAGIAPNAPETLEFSQSGPDTRIRLAGIVLSVADVNGTRALFDRAGIGYSTSGARLVVPPTAGQGTPLAFEER